MWKRQLLILLALCFTLFSFGQQDRKDRITTSYLIAFGVEPEQREMDYWLTDPLSNKTIKDLVNKHKENMKNDKSLKVKAISNSYLNAFGKYAEPREIDYWKNLAEVYSYVELYEKHKSFFLSYRDEWRKVIRLSYLQGMNREPQQREIDYWLNQKNIISFVDLKAEHFKNRANEPAWNRIDNSKAWKVVPMNLTPVIKQEVKTAIANFTPQAANVIATGGLNCISTGGLNVIATGGLN